MKFRRLKFFKKRFYGSRYNNYIFKLEQFIWSNSQFYDEIMKINFLILAHNLPDQFKLLVSCLQGNENEIFAHIDIKENQEKYYLSLIKWI
jgi:hypothetical protein